MNQQELEDKLSNLSAGQKTHVLNALKADPTIPKSDTEWFRTRGIGPKTRQKLKESGLLVKYTEYPNVDLTGLENVPIWRLEGSGIKLDKGVIKSLFESGFDFKKLSCFGDVTVKRLADWCDFPLKPRVKMIYALLVSGVTVGWTNDKQWADEWVQQLDGRSAMEIGEIKRHKSLLPA